MNASRSKFDQLRSKAEELLKEHGGKKPAAIPAPNILSLIEEFDVSQMEPGMMQNQELLKAQAALDLSMIRYYDLYDLAPVGYYTLSAKGLILEANLTAATMLGTERAALVKSPLGRFIYKQDRDIFYFHLKHLFAGNQRQKCELRVLRRDAEPFWASLESTVGRDEDDAPVCRMVMSDITERRAEQEVRVQKETLEKVFQSAPYIMLLVNEQGHVIKINRTCAAFTGRSEGEAVGLLEGEVFSCLYHFNKPGCGRNAQCSGCPIRSRVMHTFKTGENISDAEGAMRIRKGPRVLDVSIIISTVLIRQGDSEFVLVTIADVTERTRVQKALSESEGRFRELAERLQEANAALKVLLKRREEDRTEFEESFQRNVKHLIAPYLEKLKKSRLSTEQQNFLEILEYNLEEITSPFVHKISARLLCLTPTEIRVADLIRHGKTSKEISDILGVSERAAIFHRQGIRTKLGLKGKKLNLQSYLGTLR